MTRRRWAIPYLLLAPGILWLALFFVLPSIQMFVMSLSTQSGGSGLTRQYEFSWAFSNYVTAITDFPEQFVNSLVYGGMATLLCLLIGVATGTYSSVFIASMFLVTWQQGDIPRAWRRLTGRGGSPRTPEVATAE